MVSITSTGVVAIPLGKLVVDRPSFVGLAPVPPAAKNTVTKRFRPAPRTVVSQMFPAPSASTRPGMIPARAPNTAWGRKWPTMCRAATAAGHRGLRIEPSGAVTSSGWKLPSLWGTSGQMAHFNA